MLDLFRSQRSSRRVFVAGGVAIATVAAFPALTAAQSLRQRGETWTGELTGITVGWGSPFDLGDQPPVSNNDDGEDVINLSRNGTGGFVNIFGLSEDWSYSPLDGVLDHYEQLGESWDGELLFSERSSSSMTFVATSGEFLSMMDVTYAPGDDYARLVSIFTRPEDFSQYLQDVQEAITVDGEAAASSIEASVLIEAVTTAGGTKQKDDRKQKRTQTSDDGDAGLEAVRDHYDELDPTMDEILTIISQQQIPDDELDRAQEILQLWLDAPAIAEAVEVPASAADVEDAYLAFTQNLFDAAEIILAMSDASISDTRRQELGVEFQEKYTDHAGLSDDLDAALTEAGA